MCVRIISLTLLGLVLIPTLVKSQYVKFAVGQTSSNYALTNSSGKLVDFLKPSSGLSLDLSSSHLVLDSLNLQLKSSERAAYYSSRPTLSKLLSKIRYEYGLSYNQFNAAGDTQGIAFNYQTGYVGLTAGFGPQFTLGSQTDLFLKAGLSGNYLLQGLQLTGSSYYDLTQVDQFSSLKFIGSLSLEITRRVSDYAKVYASFGLGQTLTSSTSTTGSLDFKMSQFNLGIKLAIKK